VRGALPPPPQEPSWRNALYHRDSFASFHQNRRRLHHEELHKLYSSPDIVRAIKSRRMGLAEHVARMGEMRNAYNFLVGNSEGKRPLGRPDVDGKITLEWILGNRVGGCGLYVSD
jgi:hypothetical protein